MFAPVFHVVFQVAALWSSLFAVTLSVVTWWSMQPVWLDLVCLGLVALAAMVYALGWLAASESAS